MVEDVEKIGSRLKRKPLPEFELPPQRQIDLRRAKSNGQTEGPINRLKAIKRQMDGRAGFQLLRARVLAYHAMAP